jgi:hypothetical protein
MRNTADIRTRSSNKYVMHLAQDIPVHTLKVISLIVDEVNEALNLVLQSDGKLNS